MGNVMAASSPASNKTNPAAYGLVPQPVAPEVSATSVNSSELSVTNSDKKIENPGTIEDINKICKDVMPMSFEGAKVMLNKGLSNHFQVSHTINLCTATPSGYRFGATYVGTRQFTPSEAFPVLLGDIDPAGNLNANIIHQFTPRLRCKFAAQIQPEQLAVAQMTADYRGSDYTASLTLGNPNIIQNSGVIISHFLQALTPNLSLGAELAYQYGQNVPGGEVAVVSAAGRYVNGLSTWSGIIGGTGVHLCYHIKASEQLQIGVELETSFRMQESTATLGYQIDLPKANLIFRGMFDSNWNVGAVLEKRLQPLPFSFALSGRLNHVKNQFRLGCGLIIG